jgi:hypothetical protein
VGSSPAERTIFTFYLAMPWYVCALENNAGRRYVWQHGALS